MPIRRPFNLQQWIDDNRELLKPPIGNKNLYQEAGDFIVMIVGGPNARKDFHYNETEELFYQIKGDITVAIQEDGERVEIPITNIEKDFLPVMRRFYASKDLRTCPKTGEVMEVDERYV